MCVDLPAKAWLISDNRQINRPPPIRLNQLRSPIVKQALPSLSTRVVGQIGRCSPASPCSLCTQLLAPTRFPPRPARPVGPEIKLETSPRNFDCNQRSAGLPCHFLCAQVLRTPNQFPAMSLCLGSTCPKLAGGTNPPNSACYGTQVTATPYSVLLSP